MTAEETIAMLNIRTHQWCGLTIYGCPFCQFEYEVLGHVAAHVRDEMMVRGQQQSELPDSNQEENINGTADDYTSGDDGTISIGAGDAYLRGV